MQFGAGKMNKTDVVLQCIQGYSGERKVLLGCAPANTLHAISFADVLDEDRGRGYQRRFNPQHSQDFRRYIQKPLSSTIPLTFNLRPPAGGKWQIIESSDGLSRLIVPGGRERVLAQVDCQHRLGHLADLQVELPFMCFVGLTEREEMEVFNVINSKAKGLNSSLLDFHDSQLSNDLGGDRPELYVGIYLRNEPDSPWFQQLDLGGHSTSGMSRRASLRTIQKATKRFLARTKAHDQYPADEIARVILSFWLAVSTVWSEEWRNPRKNLISKGIGVYSLMELAADIYLETKDVKRCTAAYFSSVLADFADRFSWQSDGPLNGLGGEGGVKTALSIIRDARKKARLKVVARGQ
jgi:DNA sulfur modification protein DndB